jgi:GNAT superfamily N-acetyltransferase
MTLATWWQGDLLPALPKLQHFSTKPTRDIAILAGLIGLPAEAVQTRLQAGHQPYLGYVAETPVAYGWVATQQADIGELGVEFKLPAPHRYLWDFATLPAWRGRGIYPQLLQAIVQAEMNQATYFWIIYAPENRASGSGIRKAGFSAVGLLSLQPSGRAGLTQQGSGWRAGLGAALLGVPLLIDGVSPCWHCGGAAYPAHPDQIACTCSSGQKQPALPEQPTCLCVAA